MAEERITIGQTNFTTRQGDYRLGGSQVVIAVRDVSVISRVSLDAAPNSSVARGGPQVRASVRQSLERSIRDNAAVWSELANH
jgi:hypothetical protein